MRPYLLPHDPPILEEKSGSSRGNAVMNISLCETPKEETDTETPEWYGFPRVESPTSHNDSASEMSERGLEMSIHERLGVTNGSLGK
jgi:hypothetical protein